MAEGKLNSQALGKVYENGMIYALTLRKVYCDVDETKENRLLWTSQVERSVQYGTVTALVEYLAPLDIEIDHSYRVCFLAVYRTFITPTELLHVLLERYVTVSSLAVKELNGQKQLKALKFVDIKKSYDCFLIRALLSFIRLWLDKYSNDFDDNPKLLNYLEEFLTQDTTVLVPILSHVSELHKVVVIHNQKHSVSNSSCEMCHHSRCGGSETDYNLFENLPHKVAQDLTALDSEIFRAIVPFQCLDYVRQHRIKSSTVLKAINTFNRIVSQVVLTVLQATNIKGLETPSARGRYISHWIDIAQSCRLLKNFSCLKAIVSGLHSSSLYRLRCSWSTVSSDKKSILKELTDLLSCDSNFQAFRDVLDKEATGKGVQNKQSNEAVHGVVPYLGTILTDLTMLQTALPDVNKDGLINFDKRRKEFEILAKLSLFQTTASKYMLPMNISLVHWLYTSPTLSESESFRLSEELETNSPTPKSSPSHLTSPPPCQFLLIKSLQLFSVAVSDVASLNPHQLSTDLSSDNKSDKQKEEIPNASEDSSRSNSDIQDSIVVKVSLATLDTTCNYKCILINKTDHTDCVINRALEKFDLRASVDLYQLYQLLSSEREILIPHEAVVYYAIVNSFKDTPILLLKQKIE